MSATVSNHSDRKVTCTAQYTSGEQVGESKTFAVAAGKSETVPIDGPGGSGKVTGSLKCRAT
ncbi:hypothetical protein D3C80_2039990 [compost metagenome]